MGSTGVSTTAASVVTGAISSTAGVSVTGASVTGAGETSFLETSGETSLSLLGPVNRWKLPEIRRDHLPGRLVSSPERAPSSSDVTASGDLA